MRCCPRRGPGVEPLTGPLNLGVIPTLAPYFLPRLLPLVKSHYQQLQLVVHEDLTGHLLERLRGYQIDAALLALPLDGEDFEELPLFDEPFWFACPPRHPLAQSKGVTEADLHRGAHAAVGRWALPARSGAGRLWATARRTRKVPTTSALPAWRRSANWWPRASAAPCCPRWRRGRRKGPEPSFVIRPLHSANASRRIGLVWRRGYPKAQELALLGELIRDNPPSGTRTAALAEHARATAHRICCRI